MTLPSTLLPLGLMLPILFCAAYSDLRNLRIPNSLSLLALALFAASLPFLPLQEAGLRILAASVVFVLGFGLFAFGLFGGGDVKLLSCLMLFIPAQSLNLFAYVFSGSMLLGLVAISVWQASPALRRQNWAASREVGKFAMGISIAMAGFAQFAILMAAAL
ncbi:prepilin peptidase [Flavimaricola marinus]|uniref:Type IV leader peptidase family protein n=1 Tax=Flavimaricola marinus TaxID=1819565 RepID=A0A238L947_9RHOB|nr:prepilin peptidase [Flavimaricola marinus]SMY06121.1 Type IV leader peptidase family protein [Flavimaricola marinus]